eukprot:4461639-Amphidinium_carterae.2
MGPQGEHKGSSFRGMHRPLRGEWPPKSLDEASATSTWGEAVRGGATNVGGRPEAPGGELAILSREPCRGGVLSRADRVPARLDELGRGWEQIARIEQL